MVDLAEVRIWGELAGAIRWDKSRQLGLFEYSPKFLENNWDLSALKMPISQGPRIYSFPELRKGRNQTEDTLRACPAYCPMPFPTNTEISLSIFGWPNKEDPRTA